METLTCEKGALTCSKQRDHHHHHQ